jgi:4-hydroxy-tetrahydrodipicolinate synthase
MFQGVYTAMVTPFKDGKIDYESFEKLVELQITAGIDGIVPLGTTGESPTVSFEEHKEFVKHTVKIVNGRVKVIAGTGANSTDEAIHLSKRAQDDGVDAVLQVNPYYNKPTQAGLIAHFEKIAKSIKIPVMLYNIPGRTGVNFLPESVNELLKRVDNIASMKEASGDINQMMELIALAGDKISVVSGDDNLTLPLLAVGGKGVVSVVSNLIPGDVVSVVKLYNEGKTEEAKEKFYKILPLCRAIFYETNPIPIKCAMEMLGHCSGELRLPMVEISPANKERLKKALIEYGVKLK